MTNREKEKDRYNIKSGGRYIVFARICALVSAGLGLAVICAWYADIALVIQIHPHFVPMQFNTALCFLLAGISLSIRLHGYIGLSRGMGAVLLVFAGATLAQYLAVLDFGLDTLIMPDAIMVKTSHPGRMAPNTALCFIFIGIILATSPEHTAARLGFASAVVFLSMMALAGYVIGAEDIYGWGSLTRMAPHTALGLSVIGGGLLCMLLTRLGNTTVDMWSFLPVSLAAAITLIAFFAWYFAIENSHKRNEIYFETMMRSVQDGMRDRFILYEQGLRSGLALFYASDRVKRHEWKSFVQALDIDTWLPGIGGIGYADYVRAENVEQYIARVRRDGRPDFHIFPPGGAADKVVVRLIEPEQPNAAAIGRDVTLEDNRRDYVEAARDRGEVTLTGRLVLKQASKDQAAFVLMLPVYVNGRVPDTLDERRENLAGLVYAPFVMDRFLHDIIEPVAGQIWFRIYESDEKTPETLLYESAAHSGTIDRKYYKTTYFSIGGQIWTIEWMAGNNFSPPLNRNAAVLFLITGALFSWFVYAVLTHLLRGKEFIAAEVEAQTAVITAQARQQEALVEQLARSNEDLERFAYIASHDLQEPLRMVCSFTGLLEEQYADKLDETAQKYIAFANSSAERMQVLINDLLEYSRMRNDTEKDEFVHMNDIYSDVLENLQETIARSGAQITSDDLPRIKSNPVRLGRLLQNLIGNAIKYNNNTPPRVHISARNMGQEWLIAVSDNGIGIEKKYARKIFEPFERLHGQNKYSGTGMGLAICKRIVDDFGGKIWLETDDPDSYGPPDMTGAVFCFTLPARQDGNIQGDNIQGDDSEPLS